MTGANKSTAVMQRRRVAPDSLDYFPTPPWATRALCEFLRALDVVPDLATLDCWEPACGELHMARPLAEYFATVRASDVHQYGANELADFTLSAMAAADSAVTDFVITNPPFRLAFEFIKAAQAAARVGFAMLVRSAFLEGAERHQQLFSVNPPTFVLQFAERVVMLEGRLIRLGAVDPFADKPGTKAVSATAYCWLVWLHGQSDSRTRWVAPSRLLLERPGDYPDYAVAVLPPPDDGLFA